MINIRRLQKVEVNQVILINMSMKSSHTLYFRSFNSPAAMNMANHLFFLLLSLLAVAAASAQVFVSIDCGSSNDNYTDVNGIKWIADGSYIYTGENKVVKTPNSVSQEMSTLRVFRTRKKNCYSINFTKGDKVLVRASFYYGNYDHKSSPPSFDLQLDGNNWRTVDTSDSNDVIQEEAIYVVRSDAISVCLAQTKAKQFPFISALEVRSMDSQMYSQYDLSVYALFLLARNAYGANLPIRYPDDQYDRIWDALPSGTGLVVVESNATEISTNNSLNNPPSSVLQKALTSSSTSSSILIKANLPSSEALIYMDWYFSEMTLLDSSLLRSFTLNMDGTPISDPIVPEYASVTDLFVNGTASSQNEFTLVSTFDSLLPPLINAIEVFVVSDPLTQGTNSDDVQQLGLLQTKFSVLAEWTGDPCLPTPYTWDWVGCSSDTIPRITALYLSGYGLSGTLPDFSSLISLQTIDLQNNSLTGEIPSFFGNLPNLEELNMADNDLSGPVPTSLSNNKKLKLDVSGNQKLCASDSNACKSSSSGTSSSSSGTSSSSSSSKKSNKLPIILGVAIPVFIVFLVIVAFVVYTLRKNNNAAPGTMNTGQINGPAEEKAVRSASMNGQMPKMNDQDEGQTNGNYKPTGPPQKESMPPPSPHEQMPNMNGNYRPGALPQGKAVPSPSSEQMPNSNMQYAANDVTVDLQQHMKEELSDLLDQQAHQQQQQQQQYESSPDPLLNKR